jgi:MarR family transcriptional regulator, organic hydroperoxide resistance regulator
MEIIFLSCPYVQNAMTLINDIPRDRLDEILFKALQAVYKFQQSKVLAFGLDYEDIYLLQFLRNNSPARMSEIAAEMNIPVSTATRVVDRLQKRKLAARKKDVSDRRNVLVSLKPEGEDAVRRIEEQTYELLDSNLADYSEEDIASFFKTAVHLQKILATRTESGTHTTEKGEQNGL